MKALSQVETTTTLIAKLDTGLIVEFQKDAVNGVHPFAVSNLSSDQYDLLNPSEPDLFMQIVIDNNRNAFDSLFSNLD